MINRDDYTPEEWQALVDLPRFVAQSVIATGRSGPIQLWKEMSALPKAMDDAKAQPFGLVVAVAYDIRAHHEATANTTRPDAVAEQNAEAVTAQALSQIAKVNPILAAKASAGEAEGYKRWVVDVARTVAEAAKEGSLLGIGGTRVTDQEQATIESLAAALGVGEPAA